MREWVCNWKDTNYTKDTYHSENGTKASSRLNLTEIHTYFRVTAYQVNLTVEPPLQHCASLLSFPRYNGNKPDFMQFFIDTYLMEITFSDKNYKPHELFLNLVHPSHRHFPKKTGNESVELEVVACGKTALLAKTSAIQAEFVFLSRNYFGEKFYKGRDTLEPFPSGGFFYAAVLF